MLLRGPRRRSHQSRTSGNDFWNRYVFSRWWNRVNEGDDWISDGRVFHRVDAATGCLAATVCFWLWETHWNIVATYQSLDQHSSACCWPHFNQMLLQLTDVPHWFLINMFLRVGFSRCLQALVHWCGFHAAGVTENGALWCLAAQTVAARHLSSWWRLLLSSAPRVRKSTELLWHKTPDFTPDVASQVPIDQTSVL